MLCKDSFPCFSMFSNIKKNELRENYLCSIEKVWFIFRNCFSLNYFGKQIYLIVSYIGEFLQQKKKKSYIGEVRGLFFNSFKIATKYRKWDNFIENTFWKMIHFNIYMKTYAYGLSLIFFVSIEPKVCCLLFIHLFLSLHKP